MKFIHDQVLSYFFLNISPLVATSVLQILILSGQENQTQTGEGLFKIR